MAKGSETGGCLNCYAARTALRRPSSGLAVMRDSGPRWTGKVQLVESRLDAPMHWKKSQRVFVNSMSDLFHEALPDEATDRVFAVMALTPRHTYQILTKRPERMLRYFTEEIPLSTREEFVMSQAAYTGNVVWDARGSDRFNYFGCGKIGDISNRRPWVGWPLPNVWLGVSVENQETADARIPLLLQTPAAKRFVSYEPALGPVDFRRYLKDTKPIKSIEDIPSIFDVRILDWLIVGGESGPGARPMRIEWIESTIEQCRESGVACFVKQLGAYPVWAGAKSSPIAAGYSKNGNMSSWPEDLRVREFPEVSSR